MLNRRGNLPIIVLVVLTLFLTSSSLAIFYINSGRAVDNVAGVSLLEDIYVKEDIAKYYVYMVGSDLLKDDKLNVENFVANFSKFKFDVKEKYLNDLQKHIVEKDFELSDERFILKGENVTFVGKNLKGVSVEYVSYVDVDFKN